MGLFDKIKNVGGDALSKIDMSGTKTMVVEKVCKVNYDNSISTVQNLGPVIPGSVKEAIFLLKDSSDEYNNSDSPTKDDEFINRVMNGMDPELVLADLDPVVNLIPGGNMIMMVLKFIVKRKKK